MKLFIINFVQIIKITINSRIKTGCCNDKCNIVYKISVIEVKTGIGKLKNHKYDPVLILCLITLNLAQYERMESLFNVILFHGILPEK